MAGGYNPSNRDIKDRLKQLGIRAADVSKALCYSPAVVSHWLQEPCTPEHREQIEQAIARILEQRGGDDGKYHANAQRFNTDLREELKARGITHLQLADTLGINRQALTARLGKPLSYRHRREIEEAIERLSDSPMVSY